MKEINFILKYGKWINFFLTLLIFAHVWAMVEKGSSGWVLVFNATLLGMNIIFVFLSWFLPKYFISLAEMRNEIYNRYE